MSGISDVIDTLLLILEPDPTTVTRDGTLAHPYEWDADTLYGFPTGADVFELAGAGNPPESREVFEVTFVYVLDTGGEEAKLQPDRDVSAALYDRAELYAQRVAANRSKLAAGGECPWDDLRASVDHRFLADLNLRGVALVVRGYRYSRS